ncbi:hypothetical protein ADK58_16120 [Streptomyces sp. XY152]|nr:hypothetical protein ADK58_16120 [Streptomyces sp. XY152]
MQQGDTPRGGRLLRDGQQPSAEAPATGRAVHHQLHQFRAVGAVGLVGEGEAHGAQHPCGLLVRHPHREPAGGDGRGPFPPPGGRLRTVERSEEADGGAAVHRVGQQLGQPLEPFPESSGVQALDVHGRTTAST